MKKPTAVVVLILICLVLVVRNFKSDSVIACRNQSIDSLQHQLDWYENQWDIVNEDTQNN